MNVRNRIFAMIIVILTVTAAMPCLAQNPTDNRWRTVETNHFTLVYPEGQEYTANQALEVAEKVRGPLEMLYGTVDGKIAIVIRDDEDMANGGAFFYDNKIEISASSLDFEFRSYTDWLWNVVTHELTHIYSIHRAMKAPRSIPMVYYQHIDYQEEKREDVLTGYPNLMVSYAVPMFTLPSWLAEGVAQYQARDARFDRWDAHRDMIVRQAALSGNLLTLDQMAVFTGSGLENEMVYDHGFSLVRFIVARYGDTALGELMTTLSSSTVVTFDSACKRVLGVDADELYRNWEKDLETRYTSVRDSLGTLAEGELFRAGGYLNGFPTWSPDGTKLAFLSNRGQEYRVTACYIANLSDKGWQWKGKEKEERKLQKEYEEKRASAKNDSALTEIENDMKGAFDIALASGIQSAPLWLDEWNLLYNRRMPADHHGSHWWDIYRCTINTKDPRKNYDKRITHNLRGTYPDLTRDGRWLAVVKNGSGQNNIVVVDRNDTTEKTITSFSNGERIYRPRWSPDGATIAFTLHRGTSIDIALVNRDGSNMRLVIASPGQDRDPAWSPDGRGLYFSTDITGIPNLYHIDLVSDTITRLTNVIGGAFSPAPSPNDSLLAFSYYGENGYEIRMLPLAGAASAVDRALFRNELQIAGSPPSIVATNDSQPYQMTTLDFSFMPRVFNDRGDIKIGTYLVKTEVNNQSSVLFGGAISPATRDMDLFALVEYKRLVPTLFIELYRQTRSLNRRENYMEEFGTINRKRTFDLNEIDLGARYTYHDDHTFESRFIYSRYNAKMEYTHFLTGPQVHKPYYTYSQGFDLMLSYAFDSYRPARDDQINPRGGRKIFARYDHCVDFFLDDFEYVGFLKEKYTRYPYNRYVLNWVERFPVPRTERHTFQLRGQTTIIDAHIDSFYETQLGGPQQMRGYTFYSLSGRKTLMSQVLYRFPIAYNVQKSFFIWHLNHVYGGVFADIGRAWNKQSLNLSTDGFKRDAGIELRLDTVSFYTMPTMIELSAAYGFDDTWIQAFDEERSVKYVKRDDQEPWKFYCSILFGF